LLGGVGTRPTPGADGTLTIASDDNKTLVTVKAGKVEVTDGTSTISVGGGQVALSDGAVTMTISGGKVNIG
jgi:F0F1-type ATP synthase epsilon subunit